jgi:DNA polymerase-3 subunit epsilon
MAHPVLEFTAIDFETASPERSSVCAVGLARVRDGIVTATMSFLVKPPTGLDSFSFHNVEKHGITADTVSDAAEWPDAFAAVAKFVGDDPLVAHNAPFDRSVMYSACDWFDLDRPENNWHDTIPLARRTLTLASYSLPFVARELGLAERDHHDAGQDAIQAALVALALHEKAGLTGFDEWLLASADALGGERHAPGDWSGLEAGAPLTGHHVAFTGTLNTTTRTEAISLVSSLGGVGQGNVTKKTTMVVTGDFDPRVFRPGATVSSKLQKAMDAAAKGQPVEVLSEFEFLDRIAVSKELLAQATRTQRVATRAGWLPGHTIEQARANASAGLAYNAFIRAALRHPEGRAEPGVPCVRCGVPLPKGLLWLWYERHVCSGDCNDALKRAAKRAWRNANIAW